MEANVSYPRDKVAFIKIGFNDACTEFTVGFHRTEFEDLDKVFRNVQEYNEFQHLKVRKAFASVKDLVYTARFGREASPVLYLKLNPGLYDSVSGEYKTFGVVEMTEMIGQIRRAFSRARCDEFSVMPDGSIRIWWD